MDIKLNMELAADDIPPRYEASLFRVTQEALNNVAKHADAEHVHVEIALVEECLKLCIKDDGQGFSTQSDERKMSLGFGITQMRERVEQFHGNLTLTSLEEEGTLVDVRLPLYGSLV